MELVKVPGEKNTAHYEYKMLVSYGGAHWFVFKRFKQFFQLHKALSNNLSDPFLQEFVFEDKEKGTDLTHAQKKKRGRERLEFLQFYISEISNHKEVQKSRIF